MKSKGKLINELTNSIMINWNYKKSYYFVEKYQF
jgi:hypothetical protein